MYLIVEGRTIYHEGDERSRTHPGHGYAAYTEQVDKNTYIKDHGALTTEVTKLLKRNAAFKIYQIQELNVIQETKVSIA